MKTLTVSEFATRVGIKRTSAYAAVRERRIEFFAHPHGQIQIPEEAVAAYLESIRVRPVRGFRALATAHPIDNDALLERSRGEAIASLRGGSR